MNKILFDLRACQPLGHIKFHGGGMYGYVVFEELCKTTPEKIVAYWDKDRFLEQSTKQLIEDLQIESINAKEKKLVDILKEHDYLFYSPLYFKEYHQLSNLSSPVYVTIHGLRKLEMNRDSYEIKYATNILKKIKCIAKQTFLYNIIKKRFFNEYVDFFKQKNVSIITVSNHSKNSLLFYYPFLDEKKIKVFYSPSTSKKENENNQKQLNTKYYLIVSADRWLKNSLRAIEAFDLLIDNKQTDASVIIVGASSEKIFSKKIRNKNHFTIKGYVSKKELEILQKNAYALIYPSLNEGFGYPPIETMKYGTPVIASPFSSIPEICADAVIYANPYSVEEIAMRILMIEKESIRNLYSERALNQYSIIFQKQTEDLRSLTNYLLGQLK